MSKTSLFNGCLFLCVLSLLAPFREAAGHETSLQALSGTILINIDNGRTYHDFTFCASTNTLQEIVKGKVVIEKRNDRSYVVCQGSSYREKWDKVRGLQYLDEHQFKVLFDQYDLLDMKALMRRKETSECNPNLQYPLRRRNTAIYENQEIFPNDLTANSQKTHAVCTLFPGGPGLLIDLANMAVSKSFCNQKIDKIVWDKTGRYLAYTKLDSDYHTEAIILKDIKTNSVIMEKIMDREVDDIVWNPSSDHIAVLTYTWRFGYWPWELLAAVAGHPVPHNTFYLSIYDISGGESLSQEVINNVVYGMGSIIWNDE